MIYFQYLLSLFFGFRNPQSCFVNLINFSKVKDCLYKIKRKIFPACKTAKELHHVLKDHENFGTVRQRPWYQKLIEDDTSTVMLFVIDEILKKVSESCELFGDATYFAVPKVFKNLNKNYQLYNLMVQIDGSVSVEGSLPVSSNCICIF